jgi:hypothetical protein
MQMRSRGPRRARPAEQQGGDSMSPRRKPSAAALAVALAALAACLFAGTVQSAPPIKVMSQSAMDGPIRYTVRVTSKQYGNAQETRTISSGQTDDFNWKTVPPGGAVPATDQCPNYASLPLDANGAMIRQTQVRLSPVVAANGTATVQLSFQGHAPRGTVSVTSGGKSIQCPKDAAFRQIVRFTMPTNGSAKTLTLSDGTQVTVSASR